MEDKVKEMTEKVANAMNEDLVERVLTDNKFQFEIDGVKYRVRKPTFSEKQLGFKKKISKFTELMRDKDEKGEPKYLLEKDWIKQYKDRNIDIEDMDNQIFKLEKQKQSLDMILGKEIEKKSSEDDLKKVRDEIYNIQLEQTAISIQKTNLLQFSIEYQLNVYLYSFLTTQVSEKEVDGKWVKVWNSYEEFENSSDEELVNRVTLNATLLMRDESLL